MEPRIKLVTLNGPIGSGKSWTCDRLEEVLKQAGKIPIRTSYNDALVRGTMAILNVTGMDYAKFKVTEFDGKTGRDWLIELSETMKIADPFYWAKLTLSSMTRSAKATQSDRVIFLCDSNGFEPEQSFMRSRENVDVLACSIEPKGTVPRGEQYPGDSRFNLAHMCSVVAPDSTHMLQAVTASLMRRGWI